MFRSLESLKIMRLLTSHVILTSLIAVLIFGGIASDKLSITRLRSLEHQLVSAKHGLRAYQTFLSQPNISQQDRETAETRIRDLRLLMESDSWSVGGKKLDYSERAAKVAACEALIAEAIQLAEQADAAADEQKRELLLACGKKMETASKHYRGAYHADFLLGLYAASATKSFEVARMRFEECANRGRAMQLVTGPIGETNLLHALNNLALTKVREDKLQEAHDIWKEALTIRPSPPPEIVHNIIRTWRYMKAAKGGPVLKVTEGTLKKFELMANTLHEKPEDRPADRGWIYLGYLSPADISKSSPSQQAGEKLLVGSGTGIIVRPGYILCSRSLVCEGEVPVHSLRIQLGSQTSTDAKIVALDSRWDLALLHDPAIGGTPVPLIPQAANEEEPVAKLWAFAFQTPTSAPKLVSRDCSMRRLTFDDSSYGYAVDTDTSGLTNGGLLINGKGYALGVMVAGARVNLPAAIDVAPLPPAIGFLQKHIAEFADASISASADPSATSLEFGQSIVHIESYCYSNATTNPRPSAESLAAIMATSISDDACLLCDGAARVGCPAGDCANGAVAQDQGFLLFDPIAGDFKNVPTKINRRCGTCGGSGAVSCPLCDDGTDQVRLK